MPTVPLSDLTLFKATLAQTLESRKRTFVQWNRGRTLAEYLERDRIMDNQEHALQGKYTTWVLAPRDDPATLDFMCSCETYRRPAIVCKPPETAAAVAGYGIASVFTPPTKRHNGYASHMMRLLHWILAPISSFPPFPAEWGTPPPNGPRDAQFSVLYSDVGSEFYHNCGPVPGLGVGWKTVSPTNTSWDVPRLGQLAATEERHTEWHWLSAQEADDAWNMDSTLMLSEVALTATQRGKTAFAFLPTEGVAQYNIQRIMSFAPDLQPVLTGPWGVMRARNDRASLALATWTFEPGTKTMVLTRLRATEEEFPLLLELLAQAARKLDKDTIETWNLPEHLAIIAESTDGRSFGRTDHLSAVKWYGSEKQEQLLWLFNEKFAWC